VTLITESLVFLFFYRDMIDDIDDTDDIDIVSNLEQSTLL
jgi:hypothetical protein